MSLTKLIIEHININLPNPRMVTNDDLEY